MSLYDSLIKQLGDISPDQEISLRAYVSAKERFEKAEKQIAELGTLVKDAITKKNIPNPYIQIQKDSLAQIQSLSKQLGIDKLSVRNVSSQSWRLPKVVEYTDKQKLFAKHYAETRNATLSAERAGYAKSSCAVQGSSLLKEPKMRELIELEAKKLNIIKSRTSEDIIVDLQGIRDRAIQSGDDKLLFECLKLEGRYFGTFGEGNKDKAPSENVLPLYNENPYID